MITPAIMFSPPWSAPGDSGRSKDATDEVLVCREDVRDPTEPVFSRSPPRYLPSSLAFLLSLSFLLLLEKNDFPADDCLDLVSAMARNSGRFEDCFALRCGVLLLNFWMRRPSNRLLLCVYAFQTLVSRIMSPRDHARVVERWDHNLRSV